MKCFTSFLNLNDIRSFYLIKVKYFSEIYESSFYLVIKNPKFSQLENFGCMQLSCLLTNKGKTSIIMLSYSLKSILPSLVKEWLV
jgi:hypothetical protein